MTRPITEPPSLVLCIFYLSICYAARSKHENMLMYMKKSHREGRTSHNELQHFAYTTETHSLSRNLLYPFWHASLSKSSSFDIFVIFFIFVKIFLTKIFVKCLLMINTFLLYTKCCSFSQELLSSQFHIFASTPVLTWSRLLCWYANKVMLIALHLMSLMPPKRPNRSLFGQCESPKPSV